MKASSASILRENKREIRSIGSTCDASCAMWAFCQNSVSDGTCKGFLLLNGKSQNLLNTTLNEDNKIYVQNTTRMAQRNDIPEETRESLVREVLRFMPREESEPTQRPSGISYMAQCAFGTQNAPTQEHAEPESHPNSEFTRMLEASGKDSTEREEPHTAIPKTTIRMTGMLRQIDESQFPQFCDPEKCPPDFARHCSANRPENHGKPCIYIIPRNR